jgi:hypothetical protein
MRIMDMNRRVFLLASLSLLALAGCGPPWVVRAQASPNPLLGQKRFAVKSIDYTGLRVGEKTEEGYLAEKDADSRSNWAGDKTGMNDEFFNKLRSGAKDAGIEVVPGEDADYVIEPRVPWIEPGFYAVVASKPSEVQMTVRILDRSGALVDEIEMRHQTAASMTNPAVGNRLRDDAEAIGGYMAKYLEQRTSGAE